MQHVYISMLRYVVFDFAMNQFFFFANTAMSCNQVEDVKNLC